MLWRAKLPSGNLCQMLPSGPEPGAVGLDWGRARFQHLEALVNLEAGLSPGCGLFRMASALKDRLPVLPVSLFSSEASIGYFILLPLISSQHCQTLPYLHITLKQLRKMIFFYRILSLPCSVAPTPYPCSVSPSSHEDLPLWQRGRGASRQAHQEADGRLC